MNTEHPQAKLRKPLDMQRKQEIQHGENGATIDSHNKITISSLNNC